MRILIAEDDPVSRRIVESDLTRWGYDAISVKDGREAWEILSGDDPPRIAVLDWMMPEMDGVEVCRRVRERSTENSPIYIILLTSRANKEDIVLGLQAGADDYITKPFDSKELRARVQVGDRVIGLQWALASRLKELQEAMAHIKTLQGILPICMHCHRIRDDHDSWQRIEKYIQGHSDAQFSHGLCPQCRERYYPDFPPPGIDD
jgi:sigma-B regulation protein RsbU (phosphoserine phosphatase)